MPPMKYHDPNKVGEQVQNNYVILSKLFDDVGQKAFRDKLFSYANRAGVARCAHRRGRPGSA